MLRVISWIVLFAGITDDPRNHTKHHEQKLMSARLILSSACLLLLFLFGESPAKVASPLLVKRTLRVMTYNIHVGVGMDKKLDLQRIAAVINSERPDLVGLQEVDRGVKRTEGKDEILELADLTKMHYAFAHNLDFQGGQYGVAILSRFPIRNIDHRKYENKREAERRGMIRVEVEFAGQVVNFVTTHLDYQYEDGRVFETEQLLKFLNDVKGPVILVGDLNDEPAGGAYQLLLQTFKDAWLDSRTKATGLSYPADKPLKRIDYVFYRGAKRIKSEKAWMVDTSASDHLPVVVELRVG